MVAPSDLFGELAEEAILVPRLQPQNPTKHTEKIPSEADQKGKSVNNQDVISITNENVLERVRDDHALGPVVRRRDALVRLEPRESSLSPLGLVRNHTGKTITSRKISPTKSQNGQNKARTKQIQ